MKTKELIEALKLDAEWAEGHEYDAPICLRELLLQAAEILTKAKIFITGNCGCCRYATMCITELPCCDCMYGIGDADKKIDKWVPFWEEDEETEKSTC